MRVYVYVHTYVYIYSVSCYVILHYIGNAAEEEALRPREGTIGRA